jgi:hypothetical protein
MADTQEFKILITSTADNAGFKSSGEAVRALTNATKDHVTATKELGKAESETEIEIEGMNGKGREFHELLRKLNELAPGTGMALKGIFAPEALPILAVIAGVELLIGAFERLKKKSEEAATAAVAAFEAQQKAADDAQTDTDNYLETLGKIKAAYDTNKAAADLELTTLKAKIDQTKILLEYEEKRALLAAEGDRAKQEQIRSAYEGKKSQAELAGEGAELQQSKNALDQANFSRDIAQKNYETAHNAVQAGFNPADAAAFGQAQDAEKVAKTRLEAAYANQANTGTVADAQKALEHAKTLPPTPGDDSGLSPVDTAQADLEHAQQAQRELDAAKAEFDSQHAIVSQYEEAQKQRIKAENDAAEALRKYTEQVNILTAKVQEGQAVYDIHRQTLQATGITPPPESGAMTPTARPNTPFAQTPDGKARTDFTQFEAGYGILASGGKLNENQTAYMREIAQMMSSHAVQSGQLLAFMREVFGSQQSKDQAFITELENLRRQIQEQARNH